MFELTDTKVSTGKVLDEVEKTALYCGLDNKGISTARLLAEEMISMTKGILEKCAGTMWVDTTNETFEIHLIAKAGIDYNAKEEFIAASKAKKNTAPKGLFGKIGFVFEGLVLGATFDPNVYPDLAYGFSSATNEMAMWSMSTYYATAPKETQNNDVDIERTIIEKFADDVIVTVKSNWVEMTVIKKI